MYCWVLLDRLELSQLRNVAVSRRLQMSFLNRAGSVSQLSNSELSLLIHGFVFQEFAEEEELEWLSNKYEFPSVETCFGILSDNPELMLSHHSPSSVHDNSFGSGNENGNGATSKSVCATPKTPVGPRSKGRKRRRRENYTELWSSQVTFKNKRGTSGVARMGRRCLHCQSDRTPQWRAGPMGPKTLCNACGVRYKSGRLLPEYRPASSPTFSSELHSNSHRRVVEMRRAIGGGSHGS